MNRFLGWALVWLGVLHGLALTAEEAPPEKPATFQRPVMIRLTGEIDTDFESYLLRKLKAAQNMKADLILLDLESPGGRVDLSESLAETLRKIPTAKTAVYIRKQAVSGGTYLSLGCDEIVMHPEASLGDVGIIFLDQDFMFKYAEAKYSSILIQQMRTLADAKGRPAALVEAMVDKEMEVFRCKDQESGAIVYRTAKELETAADAAKYVERELVIESQKGRFLTVSGKRAVELTLAQANANSLEECQARYAPISAWRVLDKTWVDLSLDFLRLWWVTLLLLLLGIAGLGYESMAPGTCIGGLFGVICFGLFFASRFMAGTSGILEVTLFAAGLALLAAEIFVLPGFGVAGVSGIVLLVASIVLACQAYVIPQTSQELTATGESLGMAVGAMMLACLGIVVAAYFLGSVPFLGNLVLKPTAAGPVATAAPTSQAREKASAEEEALQLLVGEVGIAQTPLRPVGSVKIGQTSYDATAEGDFIAKGTSVRVVRADHHRLVVEVTG
ncbi:MAG: NfeD family protein [Planctomycetaceae bacterium]